MAYFNPPITYGVLPLAANPIQISSLQKFLLIKSSLPKSSESSAPSTAFMKALSPPAINPINSLGEALKVGGHSL